ncbi:hybrid sensor histidine kinase/response regulator transcription factor [Yeosuana marina]|uniref:hybrid sensor histidine kinase/response regulator transcription factor n=1 Tax=Yeosuana marina TaxID=1565536 RepID=UPI0030EE35FA
MLRIGTLIFLISISCFAQNTKQITFHKLGEKQGLSQNSVVSIAQDSIGYMWFATQDGLNKYDGRDFTFINKQFEDITRSTYSKLGKLYIDRFGNLWIISNSGILEKFNNKKEDFETIKSINQTSFIYQNKRNDYYIGTYGNGLYKIDDVSKDTVKVFIDQLKNLNIYDFLETQNSCYLATSAHVYELNDTNLNVLGVEDHKNNFSTLTISEDKTVWLGSYGNGLYYKAENSKLFKMFKHENLPKTLNIEDLLIDNNNNLWIATYGNGLYILDNTRQNVSHFTESKVNPYALQYNDVLCLYQDFTGTVWLGTDGAGLNYYDEHLTKFNVITNNQTPNNVNVDVVRAITRTQNHLMWFGTSGKGLTSINIENKIYKTYTTQNSSLASNRIMSLFFDANELWIGHQGKGLQVLDTLGKFKTIKSLQDQTIWKIYKQAPHQFWLCTRDRGIILFEKNNGIITEYSTNNSELTTNNIRTIEKGNNNDIWIGSEDKGLFLLNIKTQKIKSIKQVPDKIKSLYFDGKTLWIGTNGNGLKAYNPSKASVITYDKNDGLPNLVIYGILSDKDKNLWLSSNKGIFKLNLNNNKPNVEVFGNYNGLQAYEFNTGAYFKAEDGTLFFGGIEGVNWFKPDRITRNTIQPKTVITQVEVFNKIQPLKQDASYKHNQNTLTFTFAGLHFSQPERNQYKYRLLNHDSDWIDAKNTNIAHYTNLPPNTYTFEVISSNYDGFWNKRPARYSFTILKPWYLTNLLKALYAILILLFLYSIYKYLEFRWKVKTQLQLEQAETERLKKLDEFKTKLYTNISHEFRTPLTLISGPIDLQLSKKKLKPQDRKSLKLVKQNANRLLNLVNQMLDLSLIDSGQLRLQVTQGNLSILLKQIVSAFQYKAKEKRICINSKIHNLEKAWYDSDCVEKIVTNLLSNAIKYSPENTNIIIDARALDNMLVLYIINTNTSISKKDFEKLFQRFYQDNETSEGIGVGLALVKELVNLSKGNIIATALDTNKIQFTVTLPIHKDVFNDDEIKKNIIDKTDRNVIIKPNDLNKNQPILLIVEDDKDVRAFIVSIFNEIYKIIEADNGALGIDLALKHIPDVVISDIMMPVQDGIALCNTLKYNELTSHIPIILLTAKVGEENEIEGIKTGADVYMAKPFNSEKLKLRVQKLIENRQQLQKHFSKNFTINPELPITSTEIEFLKRLKEVLNDNITNSVFTSEAFAEAMHMSRTQLHRKLKAIVGMSTSAFIRSQRLKLALDLLKKSDATVSEIAYQVGFNTPSYFIKCFKEVYGTTPSEFFQNK